ncbi:hypothetical protein Dsin_010126 [Dipteronia sinensis]|uniref:Reverse transcriptase zinc-binding domain-containing protein n=1 Tax=Dipteronia sinensis TaxID=43782 RepID=A0AAE0ECD9_9ROSI|nr:hypothetical protein Dsin_010126 [Dipteronia sinensis]
MDEWWNMLWQLKIPHKVKNFTWKACLSWNPTVVNLSKKGMPVEDLCPCCLRKLEFSLHAIWGYSKLKQVSSSVYFMTNQKWCDKASVLDFFLFYS